MKNLDLKIKNLDLENYGELCSSQIYFLEDNIGQNMMYFDLKNDCYITVNNNKVNITRGKEDDTNYIYKFMKNFNELISKNGSVEIHNYDNAKEKTENSFKFIATTPDNKKDYNLILDKEICIISFIKNKYHYQEAEYLNGTTGKKIADIWVDNDSYIYFNNDDFLLETHKAEIRCSKFLKSLNSNCIILEQCPTYYTLEDKNTDNYINYEIYYNNYRTPKKIIDLDSGKELPLREEIIAMGNYEEINTLYPLLFDPFNYYYIDFPKKYWCYCTITKSSNITTIVRKIYEIDKNHLDELEKELMQNMDNYILSNAEF